ncbi:MAG: glycosyltransferase [Solirubrobacteraceae bacterium]
MRILVFHGYLLDGTGSNVYNAQLADALVSLGHEVHLLCQDRHPERHEFVEAAGDWDAGELVVRTLRRRARGARCTVYRPRLAGVLPVYVHDRYEGIEAKTFADCSDAEIDAYLAANVAAVREVASRVSAQVALANHLVLGPAILARALAGERPYAVKVHGSALEYTVKRDPERFLHFAREGLAPAAGILVGSRHTAESLWGALGERWVAERRVAGRTGLGPPGVDVQRFRPRDAADAAAGVARLCAASPASAASLADGEPGGGDGDAFARVPGRAAAALGRLQIERGPLVVYVGKLIVSKGVDLLLAAWPLVLAAAPDARLLVVGFGAYETTLLRLAELLSDGDLAGVRALALAGREREAGPRAPLHHLLAFCDSLARTGGERYLNAAAGLGERVAFAGRLDHDELADLLPACEALVAPSTFPEAFGMVAAEAAACGALPIVASHSGLAEVASTLADSLPPAVAALLSFPLDEGAVQAIAERVTGWLAVEEALRRRARTEMVATVRRRWSWEGVGLSVLAATRGEAQAPWLGDGSA